MIIDYKGALQFVEDYFQLNYSSFLAKYFPGSRQNEIKKSLTPAKFRQLFGSLSPSQLEIIKDNQSKYIVVAAGPGSGKTRILVHKLASLLFMEDVKHEQLLMVTFSRAAATEFKKRLIELIGNAANFVDIKTFHSYCFDLQGKIGSIDKSDLIIKSTIEKIKTNEIELSQITKTVLVIDEAQDMNADEFALINLLMEKNEEMRVIDVGDDDQNIFAYRGSDSKYLEQFIRENKAVTYELTENYRSKNNLVQFTNAFVKKIQHRLKVTPIYANQSGNGNIRVIHYKNNNLITPLVNGILSTGLAGTTCILTITNDEAFQITGLLIINGFRAKLIQSSDSFNLYNLCEIRYFLKELRSEGEVIVINDELWAKAKRELERSFSRSSKLELCKSIIHDFEATNTKKKYLSDLEVFIRESKLEDFFTETGEIIFVSTIHKSKGKEFDNVFLLLDNFNPTSDEAKRQLYVAMTRAKQNLTIHLNGNYLDDIKADNLQRFEDIGIYTSPSQLVMHLTHEDVNLGYFEFVKHRCNSMMSGDVLKIVDEGCTNSNGELVLKFSKKFIDALSVQEQKRFQLKEAKVNYMVFWKKQDGDQEVKIILPELSFERVSNLE
jgi:ATP-dependent DNA helicase RecQ